MICFSLFEEAFIRACFARNYHNRSVLGVCEKYVLGQSDGCLSEVLTAVMLVPQGLPGGGKDGSHKGTSSAAGNGNTTSPPTGTGGLADPECTLARVALGQSERKKRKLWSAEEDEELIAAVEKFGEGNWTNILKGSFTHERTAAQLSQVTSVCYYSFMKASVNRAQPRTDCRI